MDDEGTGVAAPDGPNWTLMRSFMAVMRAGSLTRAAAALGTTQPTVGRHMRTLEHAAGDALFDRQGQHLVPTERARDLYARARDVERDVTALARAFAAPLDAVGGTVRVTTSEIFAVHVLPPLLGPLLDRHPTLALEVVSSNTVEDLLRRDADVAVRFVRPSQPDLVARKVAEVPLGLYAARAYVERHGLPTSLDGLAGHRLVAEPGGPEIRAFLEPRGVPLDRLHLALQSDSLLVRQGAVRAGLGIGPLHRWIGDADPALSRVLPSLDLPALPVWLTAHADLNRSQRLRVVFDHLARTLGEQFKESGGTAS